MFTGMSCAYFQCYSENMFIWMSSVPTFSVIAKVYVYWDELCAYLQCDSDCMFIWMSRVPTFSVAANVFLLG